MKPGCKLHTGRHTLRDYFQFHIYAFNRIGFTLTVWGFGVSAYIERTPRIRTKPVSGSDGEY